MCQEAVVGLFDFGKGVILCLMIIRFPSEKKNLIDSGIWDCENRFENLFIPIFSERVERTDDVEIQYLGIIKSAEGGLLVCDLFAPDIVTLWPTPLMQYILPSRLYPQPHLIPSTITIHIGFSSKRTQPPCPKCTHLSNISVAYSTIRLLVIVICSLTLA